MLVGCVYGTVAGQRKHQAYGGRKKNDTSQSEGTRTGVDLVEKSKRNGTNDGGITILPGDTSGTSSAAGGGWSCVGGVGACGGGGGGACGGS